jgi:DNA polymerase III gamma/tau subunit
MRDALSLMDKVLSYGAENLTQEIVDELIPPPHDEFAAAVMARIADRDAAGSLVAFDVALQSGRTIERFCDQLIEHVRTLMLMRVAGTDTELVDVASQMRSELGDQAKAFDAPTYVYMITLLEELRRSVKFSGTARALADAAIVRLAMSRQFSDITELIDRLGKDGPADDAAPAPAAADAGSPAGANPGSPAGANPGSPAGANPGATASKKEAIKKNFKPESPTRTVTGSDSVQPAKAIGAEQWKRVASDPMVNKVKEAVDGTLFDVRASEKTKDKEE